LISGAQPAVGTPGIPRPIPPPATPRGPGTTAGPSEESIVVGKVLIQSDDRTNTLIVLSRPSNFEFLDDIIDSLDRTVEPEIRFRAFRLKHIKADDAAELILSLTGTAGGQQAIQRAAPSKTPTKKLGGKTYGSSRDTATTAPQPALPPIATRPTTATPAGAAGQPGQQGIEKQGFVLSERARVIPDPRQGSILVLGTANDLDLVDRIVPEIDVTVAQVIIESVIVEVTMNNNTEFGINLLQREWQKGSNRGGGASLPSFGSNFAPTNLFGKVAKLTDPGSFAGLAQFGGLTYFSELGGLDLDVIVRAVAGSDNFRILQKPILQSSQNEAAHIFVGETRPIVTATQTGFSTGDTTIPVRSSIEQYDIGVSLDITPNITPGGQVELQVEQTIDDVSGTVVIDGNEQPIVARRELSSIVSVKDKGVVALGGLIKNRKEKTETKVPIIGDLPLLGLLFKQNKWQDNRIELIVFLRPTVLRSVDEAQTEAQKMREKFKGLNNIPSQDVPPLPKEEKPEKKPWYAPFQPPKEPS
jgi:general secretion pathway protein D